MKSTREVGLATLGLTPGQVEALNLVFAHSAEEVKPHFERLMGETPLRLAVAGFSAPPPGYEAPTRFLLDLADRLVGRLALITSPTCDPGSIDALCTEVARLKGLPIGYLTTDGYLRHADPEKLPGVPKFSFPDADEYSRATAVLSNGLLLVGGRQAALADFHNAILQGNRVVVVRHGGQDWPPVSARPELLLMVDSHDGDAPDRAAAFLAG